MNRITRLIFLAVIVIIGISLAYYWDGVWGALYGLQRNFNNRLFSLLRYFKSDFSSSKAIILFSLSALYGLIHAIGPGHGKTVLGTYLVSRDTRYKHALLGAGFAALTHVGIAVVIAFILKYIYTSVNVFGRGELLVNFQHISGGVIAAIGVGVILIPFIKTRYNFKFRFVNTPAIGFLAGVVPCPLSLSIMMMSISYSIISVGLLAVFGIVAGIFIFLASFSIFIVATRDSITHTFAPKKRGLFSRWLFIFQGGLYILFGALLLG